uniref:TerD domain-containing protein n=1 Tax=Caenorhabditis tropicalis TaxID=1561998 RepID=A0A1I7SY47_9PELO
DIDAGLLPFGGLQINKMLEGVGVKPFGSNDTLVFDAVCTFGDTEVLNQRITLRVNGGTSVTSEVLGSLPALATCTVTEVDGGHADTGSLPGPVQVVIPWSPESQTSGVAIASLTNYYSAGQVQLEKRLEGDAKRLEKVKNTKFEFTVTCQIEEKGADGKPLRTDVVSGKWKLKGGETIILGIDDRTPILLPIGTRCFGSEINDGGADRSTIDHDSFANAVEAAVPYIRLGRTAGAARCLPREERAHTRDAGEPAGPAEEREHLVGGPPGQHGHHGPSRHGRDRPAPGRDRRCGQRIPRHDVVRRCRGHGVGHRGPRHQRSTLYYTTESSFDLDPNASSNTNPDGSVTAIWSAILPADPSKVTGVRLV